MINYNNETEIQVEGFQNKILWQNIQNPVRSIEHIANMTDLDFNGHVNNRSYINIAITTASKEIQDNYYIKKLAVKFLKQAYMNDKLICTSYETETPFEFITNITVNNYDVCKIYTAWELKTNSHSILDCNLLIRS